MMLEASVAEPVWLRITSTVQYWYGPVIFAMWLVVTLMLSVMIASKSGPKDSDMSHSNKSGSHSPFHLETGPTGRRVFVSICWLLSFSFLIELWWLMAQARSLHVDFLASEVPYWTNTARLSYIYSSVSLYLFFGVTLYSSKHGPGLTHLVSWVLGLTFEVVIIVATLTGLPLCDDPTNLLDNVCFDSWAQGRIIIASVRSFVMLGVILILSATLFQSYQYHARWQADAMDSHSDTASTSDCDSPECDETTSLLKTQETDYGTSASVTSSETSKVPCSRGRDEEAGFYRPKKLPKRNWWEYLSSYGLFWKYVWPANRHDLQFRVFLCFCILVLQRIVNVMVPWQMGRLMDYITGPKNRDGLDPEFTTQFLIYVPWVQVALLDFLFMFQGTAGVLGALRSLLWIDVSQFSYRAVEVAAFQHVHGLSLDFHLGKKTGEVLSALNKGASINNFLEQVTFNLFPMLFDLFIGVYFFSSAFDGFYGTIVCVNTIWYVWISINLARARADERREMTNADREEEAVKNDSITSYETVKYFNAEEFEYNRYAEAIDRFQAAEARLNYQTSRMTLIQACVFSGGLSLVVVIGCWQLAHGTISGGRFVTLLSYLLQMQGPLNFFNQFYRTMQQALISGERLLELFNYKPSVIDHADVQSLDTCTGHITWEGVAFAYADKTTALKNLSFECLPGTTTAFVGESGGGKSTVFRLMFRYYDSSSGAIKIDGMKVSDLSIQSVRQHIGVVPQETILFNETLMFNLRYANPKASDEDIYWACKAAKIHDKIMSFPDKYQTKVGERGMRLSGGEKQRVAIARTMLKNPKIILLDEATSALDTQTEQEIQGELAQLGVGRTLMIIAHRLSTITHADQIIVMNKGEIVEKGTHEMLLKKRGYYYSMWNQQIKTERAVQKTQKLLQQKALLKRSGVPAPSSDESESSSSGSSFPDQNSLEGEVLVDVAELNTDESDLVDGASLDEPAMQAETCRE